MPRPVSNEIEHAARPFLPKLLQLASEQGLFPGDYFLLIGKYDMRESAVIPRAITDQFLAMAKTDARRRKYERLLASPCDRHDLLVMVCAGDHVEGHWMKVPALIPATSTPAPPQMTSEAEIYVRAHLGGVVRAIREKKSRLGDWVVFLRRPDDVPVVLRRTAAKSTLLKLGAGKDLLRELDTPAPDDEVFCIDPRPGGTLAWFRVTPSVASAANVAREGLDAFMRRLVTECKESLEKLGQKPSDYLAYVRWAPEEGKSVEPIVCPRIAVHDELRALHGTKKLDQILAHLADPFDGMMLFVDIADRDDIVLAFDDDGALQAEMGAIADEFLSKLIP